MTYSLYYLQREELLQVLSNALQQLVRPFFVPFPSGLVHPDQVESERVGQAHAFSFLKL